MVVFALSQFLDKENLKRDNRLLLKKIRTALNNPKPRPQATTTISTTTTMKKITKSQKRSKNKCLSCFHNISQLEKLCYQKGLLTTFTKHLKSCTKHLRDKTIIIYNSNKLSKSFWKSLKFAICAAINHNQKAKVLKKRHMKKDLSYLCAFKVEQITDVSSPFRPIQTTVHDFVAPAPESKEVDDYSGSTDIVFANPEEQNVNAQTKCNYIPNVQDSLGLLNCTISQASQELEKVRLWTKFGHPYVNELPESQYEIPGSVSKKNQFGWISPALSPISS